jgi:hypothetical protein
MLTEVCYSYVSTLYFRYRVTETTQAECLQGALLCQSCSQRCSYLNRSMS